MIPTSAKMNPFPGLRPFTQEEDYLFFGREEQTIELLQRLGNNRFVAVVGSSGSGKSSLVRCGLLSELLGGRLLEAGAAWEVAVTHPGGNPLGLLTEALLDADLYDRDEENARENLLATLSRSHFGLVEAVKQSSLFQSDWEGEAGEAPAEPGSRNTHRPGGSAGALPSRKTDSGTATNFLLVVDQFEEIFRFNEAGQRQQEAANEFVSLLLEAASQKEVPIYVVLTMRSDFIGECGQFEGLAERVNQGEFLIPRLTREQYKRVIEGPIKVAGGQIAPRLLQRLLNDLGQQADQLPCLQHALMRTWNVKNVVGGAWRVAGEEKEQTNPIASSNSATLHPPRTTPLDLDDYQRVGKMSQALSLHADEIYESLASDRQRELCKGIFQALTVEESNSRGIRRPQRLGRLCQILEVTTEELRPVIDAYRQSGVTFLMPSPEVELTDQTIIDISHESLMRVWTRLRQWVEEETQAAGIYHRLSESADLHEQAKAGLYRDPELGIALAWRETKRPNAAWAERYRPGFDSAMKFLEVSQQSSVAEVQAHEAARQHELEQAQQLAEAQQLRLEQQQRSARKLRKMMTGLAAIAVVAGIACIAALVANNQANKLRIVASQEAENSRQSEDRAKKNADKAEQSALEANRLSEAAQLAERAMERTAQQAEADRIVAQRESYRFTVKLAESMLQGNEEAKFRVADILWQTQPELRAWEWGYLMAQCPLEEWSLQTDATGLSSAVATVDGRFLVTAGIGGYVALWNLESRQQIWQQTTGRVHEITVDRQGQFVAVSTADTALPQFKILELATGNLVHQSDRTGLVECTFSARGEDLYVLEMGTLRCIATSTWRQRAQAALKGEGLSNGYPIYNSVFVDEAGKYVGVNHQKAGGGQSRFSFFDARTLGSTTQLAGYNEVGNSLGNPSTPILNSVQGELTYSITSSVYRKTIDGERSLLGDLSDYVLYLTVDPVSGNVLSATANGAVQIVDRDGGKHSILHGAPITGLATLPHGRFVTAGADGLVKCWTLTPTESLASKTAGPVFGSASANFVDFTSDGKSLLYRTWDRHNSLYQLDSLSYRHFQYPDRAGNKDAAANNNVFPMIRPHTNELVDYSNDGLLFFPGGSGGTVGESTRSIPVSRPFSAAFDDKGRILVVAPEDGNPAAFDLESNEPVPTPNVNGHGPVAINRSGSRAAVQTREKLLVWEVATGRLLNSLDVAHNGDAKIPPIFHPEGELIAVLANPLNPGLPDERFDRVVLWNSSLGKTQTTIESQPGVSFKSCKFSADGHRLYVVCSDNKVRILDWKLGKEFIALTGGTNLDRIAVNPDGLTLAYAGYNPNLIFVKSLPWAGEIPRSSNFYRAVDDLRLYTVRTAQTINESIDLTEFTNHSDKPIRIDYQEVVIRGLFKSKKRTLRTIDPKETIPLSKVSPGMEFQFIDPESSEQLASFTKTDSAITTEEGPVGIKVVLPGRDPMTQAAAEELQGDIANRQGRPADAIAHYTRAVSIRTSIVRDNPSKASYQGSLAIVFLKNLAVTPGDKPVDRTAVLQQAISFWQTLTQNPESNLVVWQHLLRFHLQLVDHLVAIGAAESQPQVVSLLSNWNKQSKNHPANRLLAYGLSELIRKLPAVYPDGIDQPTLDSLISDHPELAGVIGDAYAAERNWVQAVALYGHGIQPNAPSLGLFAKRAMAYEQQKNWEAASADWLRAVPVNPDASRRLVSLVQRLTDGEEFALAESVRVRARLVFEEQLVMEPENSSLAGELADLLLADTTRWTVVKPTGMKSESGATLTVLDDHSILASGKNPLGDAYRIVTESELRLISVVRLEALTHESLPNRGPGRDEVRDPGNFDMVNLGVSHQNTAGQAVPIRLSRAVADYDYNALHATGSPMRWNITGGVSRPHAAVFLVDNPVKLANGGTMEFHLQFSNSTDWPKQNLGRFRLSVTDDPTAFDYESKRFAALKIADPWQKLAVAYQMIGDDRALDNLLARRPEAAIGIGDLNVADKNWERAVANYSKFITAETTDATLLAKRAEVYEKLEQWDLAIADWTRASQLQPYVAFQRFKTDGAASWRLNLMNGAAGSMEVVDATFVFTTTVVTGTDWHVAPTVFSLQFENGVEYVVRFKMKSPDLCPVRVQASINQEDHHEIGLGETFIPPSEFQDYEFRFIAHDVDSGRNRFQLHLGAKPGKVMLKEFVILKKLDAVQLQNAFDESIKRPSWNKAAEFSLQLIQRNPKDTFTWLKAAPVLALADDPAIYSDFCERMVAQFADSNDAVVVERTIKACLLRVNSIDLSKLPAEKLARMMDEGTVPDGLKPWGWGARAFWAYRSGDAESAVKYVAKSEEHTPADTLHAINLAVLAMARHQQKDPQAARQALDEALQLINRLKSDENNIANHDLLIPQILFREAEALINGKPNP